LSSDSTAVVTSFWFSMIMKSLPSCPRLLVADRGHDDKRKPALNSMRQVRRDDAVERKQVGQRQSPVDASPESGSRNGSAAHQQSRADEPASGECPARALEKSPRRPLASLASAAVPSPQSNARPQPAQTSRRGAGAVGRGSIAVGCGQIPRFQKSK
jgi:hypothetical protein